MTALVDTNVILDVLLQRDAFVADSAAVMAAIETSRCGGLLCATTITTIHYIARRHLGTKGSTSKIADLMSIFAIAPVNQAVLKSSLSNGITDFEDAVLHESALQAGADCIVTRNVRDFKKSKILVYTPAQFIKAIA